MPRIGDEFMAKNPLDNHNLYNAKKNETSRQLGKMWSQLRREARIDWWPGPLLHSTKTRVCVPATRGEGIKILKEGKSHRQNKTRRKKHTQTNPPTIYTSPVSFIDYRESSQLAGKVIGATAGWRSIVYTSTKSIVDWFEFIFFIPLIFCWLYLFLMDWSVLRDRSVYWCRVWRLQN